MIAAGQRTVNVWHECAPGGAPVTVSHFPCTLGSWPAKTPGHNRLIYSCSDLLLGDRSALLGVPSLKPLLESLSEFFARNGPVFIRVQRFHKSVTKEHTGPETATRSTAAPFAAATGSTARSTESKFRQCVAFRFACQLRGDRFRSGLHKSLDRLCRIHKGA